MHTPVPNRAPVHPGAMGSSSQPWVTGTHQNPGAVSSPKTPVGPTPHTQPMKALPHRQPIGSPLTKASQRLHDAPTPKTAAGGSGKKPPKGPNTSPAQPPHGNTPHGSPLGGYGKNDMSHRGNRSSYNQHKGK